jgi:hypothetical protein
MSLPFVVNRLHAAYRSVNCQRKSAVERMTRVAETGALNRESCLRQGTLSPQCVAIKSGVKNQNPWGISFAAGGQLIRGAIGPGGQARPEYGIGSRERIGL